MEIFVNNNKLRKAIGDEVTCKKKYGEDMAKKIKLRVAALRAADSLADFWPPNSGPERCHELKADRKGTFSLDLVQPFRLLFRPNDEVVKADEADEQKRWQRITSIDILVIEDTHG